MEITKEDISKITSIFPGNYAIYKLDGGVLRVMHNAPDLSELSGMGTEEYNDIVKDNAANIVLESDRRKIAGLLADVLKDPEHSKDIGFTYRIMHKTKGFIWIHAISRVIGTIDGCPVLLTAFLDTSSESQPQAVLIDGASSLIYVIESDTHEMLYASSSLTKHLKKTKYSGLTCHKFANGLDEPCPWCFMNQMKNGSVHIEQFHMPVDDFWFRVDCREMDWFGRAAVAVYLTDITEQVRSKEKLVLDKQSIETVVSNSPVGIAVFKIDRENFTPLTSNEKFVELCGYTADGSVYADSEPVSRVHPDDRSMVASEITRLKEPGTQIGVVYRYDPNENGVYRWYRMDSRSAVINGELLEFVSLSDVTAEKDIEAEVMTSQRMYEAAVETANMSVWEYDIPNRRIILSGNSVTRSDCAKYNIPKIIENVPESVVQWIDDKDKEKMLDVYRRINAGEKNITLEYWYKTQPGQEPRCERLVYTVIAGDGGKPVKAYGIGQNITSEKLKEIEYTRAYQELSQVDPSTLGSFRLNLTTDWCGSGRSPLPRIVALQDAGSVDGFFKAIADRLADDGKICEKFLSVFNRKSMLDKFRSGETRLSAKAPVVTVEKGVMWAEGFVRMMLNPTTNEVEAVAWAHDITDQEKDNEIIGNVADRMYDHIGIIDPAMHTYELRRKRWAFDKTDLNTKLDYDATVSGIVDRYIVPEDREKFSRDTALDNIVSAVRANGEYTVTFRCYADGGRMLRKQVQYGWLDASKMEILAMQSDITALYDEEQRHMRELTEALEKAETANMARSEFISRISHDVRTPMNAITSMTAFALEDMNDPEKLRNDLEKIHTSNTFLLSLINDILDISKIDSGKMELHPEPYPYEEYAQNVKNMFSSMCSEKGIDFSVEHGALDGVVVADRIRLNQVVLNLVSNAVKYTDRGGKVTFTSHVKRRSDGLLNVGFDVRDTGIGMSEEFQKKMFEPFSQEGFGAERKKQAAGSGLGLSIVKRIVDIMGGEITVKSELGKGTDIEVRFVFPEAEKSEESMTVKEDRESDEQLSGKVILAEDNEINTEIAVRLLESYGLEVIHAPNGARALEAFERSDLGEFSLILMDIQMPVMDGYESAENIRALPRPDAKTVPIIAMTADAFSEAVERSKEAGMNEHVAKPIDPDSLRKTLAGFLNKRQ